MVFNSRKIKCLDVVLANFSSLIPNNALLIIIILKMVPSETGSELSSQDGGSRSRLNSEDDWEAQVNI